MLNFSPLLSEIYFALRIEELNTFEILGNWNETKVKLQAKFAIFTDSDLLILDGRKDEMEGRFQTKLNKTKEECIR